MIEKLLTVDKKGLIDFTQQIIRIPSTSLQEEKVALVVAEKMRQVGFEDVTVDPVFNVVGYLRGDERRGGIHDIRGKGDPRKWAPTEEDICDDSHDT